MFGWILWASLISLSSQDMNGQDNGVIQCEPQNVKVHNFPEEQRISLIWEDDPFCARIHEQLIYEVEVLLPEDIILHQDDVIVLPDQAGTAHSWNWTSPLPLECAAHSVRLHSKYKNHTGKTFSNKPHVFPRDRVVEVGSNFTFYCILGAEWKFEEMDFRKYSKTQTSITNISDGIYAMTAHLQTPSIYSGTDVYCNKANYGATIYIGYPPGDMNLTCETRDLKSMECHWSEGRYTHLYDNRSTYYLLDGRHCPGVCKEQKCKCNLPSVQVDAGEKNWTLKAQNPLGIVELTDRADLSKRVHMLAPVKVTASIVNARNVSLKWQWAAQRYNTLHLECQVRLNYSGQTDMRNDSGSGLDLTVLNGLIPKQTYIVQVRCRTRQHFWKWGDWSEISTFDTKGDVPDVLDVWMLLKSNQTIITWKTPLANQSHGQIIDYEVTWGNTTEEDRQKRTISPPLNSTALSLNASEEHMVTVTARNSNGSSPPSAITVPRLYPDQICSKIIGSNGGFDLSWSICPAASCGYVVDWCPTCSDECRVEWMNVSAGVTEARILSENFKDGVRYTLSIYACTQGAPKLLERREGYIKETRIPNEQIQVLESKQDGSDVQISWIPLGNQTAFVQGYILYYKDNTAQSRVFNISTDDPEASNLTARNLPISSYRFTVKALTSVGEGGDRSLTVTMKPLTENAIIDVVISLATVFTLLSLVTVLCYRNWTCVKQKIYPPIPKPVLTDGWLTKLGDPVRQILKVAPCPHSEIHTVAAPELCCTLVPESDGINQEEGPLITQTQSPKGYYNRPLKKSIPAHLTLIPKTISSPTGSPSHVSTSIIENLTYNMVMQTTEHTMMEQLGEYQPNTDLVPHQSPQLLNIMSYVSVERNSCGYQPRCLMEPCSPAHGENYPESPLSISSTYLLIPGSSSK